MKQMYCAALALTFSCSAYVVMANEILISDSEKSGRRRHCRSGIGKVGTGEIARPRVSRNLAR